MRLAPGLLAAALAGVVFAGSLGHAFAYDDAFVFRSPLLADPWNLRALFTGGFYAPNDLQLGLYRPLGQASLIWNAVLARALFGAAETPALFHAANLLLHAGAAFLLFVWLSRLPLSRFVAGCAAVLWALHPIHAEVAANVTARYESLAAVLGLGFLIAHRSGRGLAAAALLLAALLAKESALVFLPLALAADACFPVGGRRFRARPFLPAAAAVALWFGLRALALAGTRASTPFVENPIASASFLERAPTAAWVQVLCLRDQLLPLWLSTDHSYAQIDLVRSSLAPGPLLFLAIVLAAAVLAWALRRKLPVVAFCVIGYAVAFSLASNFLVPIGTIMADRLAYVPSMFVCLLAAVALAALSNRARTAFAALASLALALSSFAQVPQWKDDLALFTRQVETAPRSAKSHGNLGNALRERGRIAEAAEEYRRSIAIHRFRPEPHQGLAQVYEFQRADPELRIATWADAIRFGTSGGEREVDMALDAIDLGRWPDLAAIRGRMASDPAARFLVHLDRILAAARELGAEAADPGELARARELLARGDLAAAQAILERAIHRGTLAPAELAGALLDLARCHEGQGRPRRAEHLRRLAPPAATAPQPAKRTE